MKAIRILLADDHTLVRNGLKLLLERQPDFQVVAEASDGREVLRLIEQTKPDAAVLDIGMPNLNGIETARRIADAFPDTVVAILSMHKDEAYVVRAKGRRPSLSSEGFGGQRVDRGNTRHKSGQIVLQSGDSQGLARGLHPQAGAART